MLLVQHRWAMSEPQTVGRVTSTDSHAFFINQSVQSEESIGLYGTIMEKSKKEELQSRRDFFKKAAQKALPILGAVVIASTPIVGRAMTHESHAESSCYYGCTGDCSSSCSGGCMGCTGSCTGGCQYNCGSACNVGCSYGCSGGCSGTCSGSCSYMTR